MIYYFNVIALLASIAVFAGVHSQFFHPILDDKSYLDNMEMDVKAEVEQTAAILLREARLVEVATREYIGAKLKENVFKALRVLAEQEMSKMDDSSKSQRKQPRQEAEEGESSGGSDGGESSGGGDSEVAATTELTGLGTAVKINQNVFKFIGDTFKIIFKGLGGKVKKSPKQYVDEAASLMNEPFSEQLLGLVGLIANESQMEFVQPKPSKPEEYGVYTALFHRGLARSQYQQANPVPNLSKFNVDSFVKSFKASIDEVQDPNMVLDLYRGVRESYKFLESMSTLHERIQNL